MYANAHMGVEDPEPPKSVATAFEVLALAASAGGIVALRRLLSDLPEDFPAPVLVVQHLPPSEKWISNLCNILARSTKLRVKWAEDGEIPQKATVYLAPQDRHMTMDSAGLISLNADPKVNFSRPSADRLFQSLAPRGKRVICVVLSGSNADGAQGAREISQAGGRVLAQDEETSESFEMPLATIRKSTVDFVFPLSHIARALIVLFMIPGGAEWFQVKAPLPALAGGIDLRKL